MGTGIIVIKEYHNGKPTNVRKFQEKKKNIHILSQKLINNFKHYLKSALSAHPSASHSVCMFLV